MPMNNRILRPLARPLLLDAVPGAAGAYSLRQLSNSYTGPVVTVRRSSDNAEEDFKASEIDDGTLTAFCGAGDGLVKTWHDQSGNGRDASNTTAAQQPKVVGSGSLVTEGGKAAVEFDGSDDFLQVDSEFTQNALVSIFAIASSANVAANQFIVDNSNSASLGGGYSLRFFSSGGFRFWAQVAGYQITAGVSENGRQYLLSALNTSATTGTSSLRVDGALVGTAVLQASLRYAKPTTRIGQSEVFGGYLNGALQELIVYPSDQTANRERIEGDLAWYY
jgi:trimeric autotransporter adhesin